MKVLAIIAGFAALTSAAATSHSSSGFQLFEKLRTAPTEWRKVGTPRSNMRMKFRVALKSVSLPFFFSFSSLFWRGVASLPATADRPLATRSHAQLKHHRHHETLETHHNQFLFESR